MLPGAALEHYQVVLDYPRQLLSIGEPGTIPHQGERLSSPYLASSGHPRVEVSIAGTTPRLLGWAAPRDSYSLLPEWQQSRIGG